MKRLLLLSLLLLVASTLLPQSIIVKHRSATPIALVNNATCFYTTGTQTTCTTPAVNMTGATLLTMSVSSFGSQNNGVPSDSSNNIWYGPLFVCNGACTGSTSAAKLYYAPNATVSASQTFTYTRSPTDFSSVAVEGFSNVSMTAPAAQFSSFGSATTATSVQPGSITPATNGQVVVSNLFAPSSTVSIAVDSGFTITNSNVNISNMTGYGMAYLVQGVAAAVNPTWSWTTAGVRGSDILSFLPNGGTNYTMFMDFENSTDTTTLTAAILAAGTHASGPLNGLAGSWASVNTPTSAMTVSTACQRPQLTTKNVAGTGYNDSGGTRGIRYDTSASINFNWKYTFPPANPSLPASASYGTWLFLNIATSDTGFYNLGGLSNSNGDSAGIMVHSGQVYLETGANPNGAPDVGSFFNYTQATWYYFTMQFQSYVSGSTFHTMKIYDTSGSLLSTQQKVAFVGHAGSPTSLGIGRGGDSGTTASQHVCYDGLSLQWEGAAVYPILP